MVYEKLKQFWIEKVDELKFRKGVATNLLTENGGSTNNAVWQNKLKALVGFDDIKYYAFDICQDIYAKSTILNVGDVWPVNPDGSTNEIQAFGKLANSIIGNKTASEEFNELFMEEFRDLEREWINNRGVIAGAEVYLGLGFKDLENVIDEGDPDFGVAPHADYIELSSYLEDLESWYRQGDKIIDARNNGLDMFMLDATANGVVGFDENKIDEYARAPIRLGLTNFELTTITNKLGTNTLNDIPVGKTLTDLLTVANNLTTRENQIKIACGLNPVDPMPANNWANDASAVRQYFINNLGLTNLNNLPTIPAGEDLNSLLDFKANHACPSTSTSCSKTHCPNSHSDYNTRYTESEEYKRIKGKLNNKVSDSELQALLDATLTSPHADYNSIKSERDTLKTENTQLREHECDYESKVAAKEKEIITKIITDLSLSTERERENVLEAVITEIKGKITPPSDNGKLSEKQNKVIELEQELSKLKAGKPQVEVVEKITKFSKRLNLSESQIVELKKANNYQSLFAVQSKMVESKLNEEVKEKNHAQTLNYVLGAISLGSLLILAWILMKRTNFTPKLGNKEKK